MQVYEALDILKLKAMQELLLADDNVSTKQPQDERVRVLNNDAKFHVSTPTFHLFYHFQQLLLYLRQQLHNSTLKTTPEGELNFSESSRCLLLAK